MGKKSIRRLWQLCKTMLRIGCVGFGGGSALIPILEEDVVQEQHLISEEEFNKDVVVASITPGALPVEIACGIGRKVAGKTGMVLAAACIALPGVLMTVLLSSALAQFGTVITRQVNYMAVGVTGYIIYVLACYTRDTVRQQKKAGKLIPCCITIAVVCSFTAGKHIKQILELEHSPIFAVSTVSVMVVTLFLVFYLRGNYQWPNTVFALSLSVLYLLSVGQAKVINSKPVTVLLLLTMAALSAWGIRQQAKKITFDQHLPLRKTLWECGVWALFLLLLSLPTLGLFDEAPAYILSGCISTLISFGGGDAYLAVAGGMFVASGFVLYTDFYSNAVPAANAFPGSILCKVLSCTGYLAAYRATGSIWVGYWVALCGFGCSVAVSGLTFSVVNCFYERMERIPAFRLLSEVIRPVICGLLLTVGLSFYYTCMNTGAQARWPNLCAPGLCVAIALGCTLYVRKWGQRPLRMVIVCAVVALVCCNGFALFV